MSLLINSEKNELAMPTSDGMKSAGCLNEGSGFNSMWGCMNTHQR